MQFTGAVVGHPHHKEKRLIQAQGCVRGEATV